MAVNTPSGETTITPHLWFNGDCERAVDFYQRALGAQVVYAPERTPDGKQVMHAMLRVGNSNIMMADSWAGACERGPIRAYTTAGIHLTANNVDDVFNQAVNHGCAAIHPPEDMFWGVRGAKFKDPFGHVWAVSSGIGGRHVQSGTNAHSDMMARLAKLPQLL